MSKLQEEIKEARKAQGGELLLLKDKETEIVKFDLDKEGNVMGHTFGRVHPPTGIRSKAVMFPVTIVNTGERKNFPLTWADALIEKVQRKKQPVVEVTRRGINANYTSYDFQTIG